MEHKFDYNWTLANANFTKDKGTVFSCFSCGGGSTMGYKLAGFDVLGCNEIDKRMLDIYQANHHPKYAYLESIRDFKLRDDLPDELYHLDILDGSPPCFEAGTLINTARGFVKIEDVTIDDYVLTHNSRYKKVTNIMNKQYAGLLHNISALGSELLKCTPEHPFLTKKRIADNCKFDEEVWLDASNVEKGDYVSLPISMDEIYLIDNTVPIQSEDFWRIVGMLLGNDDCVDATVELREFLQQFGNSDNRHIPTNIMHMSLKYQKSFIDGYVSTKLDTPVNSELLYGINYMAMRVYNNVNSDLLNSQLYDTDRQSAFFENNKIWVCVKNNVTTPFNGTVYNLSVEDDESYTANNIGVHNCSSFSIAGSREKMWGVEKKFAEGQELQILDTLFFDFIDVAKKLQPKIVVAENVKGLLLGAAMSYVDRIYKEFDEAGYRCQHFLLNAANMGVPQRRERVFFIATRKDLYEDKLYHKNLGEYGHVPLLRMIFNEQHIPYSAVRDNFCNGLRNLTVGCTVYDLWTKCKPGYSFSSVHERGSFFIHKKLHPDKVCNTLTAQDKHHDGEFPRKLHTNEIIKISTFPSDFNFNGRPPIYVCGMSVPPIMTAQIATNIYEQLLK